MRSQGKSCKSQLKRETKQVPSVVDVTTAGTPEILKITPVQRIIEDKLLASTSREPMIIKGDEGYVGSSGRHSSSFNNIQRVVRKSYESKSEMKETPSGNTKGIETLGLAGFIMSVLCYLPLAGLILSGDTYLGILVLLFPVLGFLLAVLAVIFGAISLHKIHRYSYYGGRGFGIASIILGAIGTLILGLILGIFIALIIWGSSGG
jgi:hypothetical protein